jgi:hypothetical protein
MALFQVVCFSLFALFPLSDVENPGFAQARGQSLFIQNCDLNFEVKSSRNTNQNELFNLTIEVRGGNSPYNYVLIDAKGKLASYDHSTKEYKNIKTGQYRCIVVDSRNCRQEKLFELR